MKQFTTPTIKITIKDAKQILEMADEIIFTVSDDVIDIDVEELTIDGEDIYATLTEEQTGSLSSGSIKVEITIRIGNRVLKTKTKKTKLIEAVRDRLFDETFLGGDE